MRDVRKSDLRLADLLDVDELQSIQNNLDNLSGSSIVISNKLEKLITNYTNRRMSHFPHRYSTRNLYRYQL